MFPLVLMLLLIMAGISIIVKGEVNVSKGRVLRKPKSMYIGAGVIAISVLGWLSGFLIVVGLVVLVIVAFSISEKAVVAEQPKM